MSQARWMLHFAQNECEAQDEGRRKIKCLLPVHCSGSSAHLCPQDLFFDFWVMDGVLNGPFDITTVSQYLVLTERTTDVPSLQYIFNMWTVSSDVSIQRRLWQPLSVHLWTYCTHPPHDVNDAMCEGWPHHQGLRSLLFSNSGVGSFTSHKNQISVSAVRRDLRFFVLIWED